MKKSILLYAIVSSLCLFLMSACVPNEETAASQNTPVRPNGQYFNSDGILVVPGLDGEVIGDGSLPSLSTPAEMEELNKLDIGLPEEAFTACGEYALAVWEPSLTGLQQPSGIIAFEEKVLVVDSDSHCLIVLDMNGNRLQSIGAPGNGDNEFLRPSAIRKTNNGFCILDAGNDRIVNYSDSLEYQGYQQLIRPSTTFDFYDFAYDEQGALYLSRMDPKVQRAYCYASPDCSDPTPIAENCCASLAVKDGDVYVINYGTSFIESNPEYPQDSAATTGFASGRSFLFSADVSALHKEYDLPAKLSATSFCFTDNALYVYSASINSVLQFDLDGNFIKTIMQLPTKTSLGSRLEVDSNGHIYVSVLDDPNLYVISPITTE